ncbi:hypothetical protein [Parapedobacter koreensis]|uniref:Uncharacterized protein n=1 Tax=Parapedobacter koreensis TaxID=332977 RepID=A0A1H7TH35_9SPHI|nr:hypothetical protein [Parapedobacter koreensis]SEL83704.1 hypothetical protein SAMN05421740_11146 [Parapedobacter koreensis]
MDTITLKIKNKKKLNHLLAFLKDLDFVEVLQSAPDLEQDEKTTSKGDFFALAGMWEGRDITAEELRAKAWPKKY